MIQIEFQLTFEEFQEGMYSVRRQITRRTRKDVRGKRFVIMIASWVLFLLFWAYMWPAHDWLQLWPHLFWLSAIAIMFLMVFVLARGQFDRRVSQMWEEVPHLRQLRTVRFDEQGVTTDHALLHSLTRWPMYQRLDETPRLFLLCASDYNADIYPKRAFSGSSADEFWRMALAKLGERLRAFEVVPVLPLPPEQP